MRIRLAKLAMVAIACAVIAPSAEAAEGISGQWSSASFDGTSTVVRKECTAVSVTQRDMTLSLEPGTTTVKGHWLRWTRSIWMDARHGTCRWYPTETQLEPTLSAIWEYALTGTSDPTLGTSKMHAEFRKCEGNGCKSPTAAIASGSFDIEVKLVRPGVLDTKDITGETANLELIHVSDEAQDAQKAKFALAEYLKILDGGDPARFYDTASSLGFEKNIPREPFINLMTRVQTQAGKLVSRRNLNTLYVNYAPLLSKTRGDYLFVYNAIETSKGIKGTEFVLLVKENSTWKVAWINYGG